MCFSNDCAIKPLNLESTKLSQSQRDAQRYKDHFILYMIINIVQASPHHSDHPKVPITIADTESNLATNQRFCLHVLDTTKYCSGGENSRM